MVENIWPLQNQLSDLPSFKIKMDKRHMIVKTLFFKFAINIDNYLLKVGVTL